MTRQSACFLLVFAAFFAFEGTPRGQPPSEPQLVSLADPDRLSRVADAIASGLPYVPGEVLVKFRADLSPARAAAALSTVQPRRTSGRNTWIGDWLLATDGGITDSQAAADVLRSQPEVEFAEPNYIRTLHSVPNDPLYTAQWNMDDIDMPRAWDISSSAGQGVTVAILDSGLTTYEGTLTARIPVTLISFGIFSVPFARPPDIDFARVAGAVEFTPTGPWVVSSSGQRFMFDAVAHGTHVAGTVAQQTNNSLALAGIASGATLMPVKVCFGEIDFLLAWGALGRIPPVGGFSGCTTDAIVEGLHYAADNGAKVINMSFGGPLGHTAERDAIQYAVSRGAFVSLSAGNEALEGNPADYPAAFAAGIQGAVAVGATTLRRTRALYSNYGSYVEIAAPGGEGGINGCAADSEVITQVAPDAAALNATPPRFNRYIALSICGTSMAAPHVAGAAALLYAQGITNPAAIEAALERSAIDLGAPGRDPEFGYGLIDVRSALLGMGVAR